ncbi:serine/threonine-protein kinase [Spirillospora sp. NPDC047279]|uniref:serine/threonine-protein kinase n=1 Tax=Spirillospora sp. NPDC047279 TaxID=3155478 RepID=UPI0033EFB87F
MKGVVTSGERIGHYRVLRTLGEGGMGVVHLGVDPQERNVAIKVLRPQVAGDATARRRLAREVDSMRRVHSPHVAEILDADVTADRPYIVTQYVPGRTLEEIVEENGPIFGQSLQRLATGLASALSAIHGAGIVHRDLKPGNVMLVDSEPVVIDFGIAQAADATRLTATGMVIGTPGYLAPEIIEGEDAGPASDVHAWAGTLAYAATGRPPFGSGTFESIFYKIMQGAPDLDGMPEAILPVVRSAMARHPAERPTAVTLVQLTRRIHLEATITDQTRVDEHYTRPDNTSQQVEQPAQPSDHARQFAMPVRSQTESGINAVPPPAPAPPTSGPRAMPAPVSSQPRDFVGQLPPAAPPPAPPPPAPTPQEYGYNQPQTRPRRGGLPPRQEVAPYAQPQHQDTQQRPDVQQRRPDVQQRPPAPEPRDAPTRRDSPERRKPYGWYRVMSFLVLVALLGFAHIAPLLAVGLTIAGVLVLRAGDKAAKGMEGKRTRRGPRAGDALAATFKSPLHLPGAVMMTLLLAPLALIAGGILLGVLMFTNDAMTASRAIAYSAMLVVGLLCLAPGSGAPRRQMARLWGALLPRTEAAVVGAVVLGLFAGVLVLLSQQQPPDTTPLNGMSQNLEDLRGDVRELIAGIPFL